MWSLVYIGILSKTLRACIKGLIVNFKKRYAEENYNLSNNFIAK